MQRSDFHYSLPDSQIAQFPTQQRGSSRLLYLEGEVSHDLQFGDLERLLQPDDLLVLNNTRVLRARLFGHKQSGGKLELLLERLLPEGAALAQIKASKAPKPGSSLWIGEEEIRVEGREQGFYRLRTLGRSWEALMAEFGHIPLPPYIQRPDQGHDEERYQTVFASQAGAVAAPTAGLHFDQAMLQRLQTKGVSLTEVTLHVGAGTFQPVRVDVLAEHRMHSEWIEVSPQVCQQVAQTQARGGRVVAVGTTSVRALESAARSGELQPYRGETDIFITPGYRFQVVDALLTNFHLPESTLLMLVCAFAGYEAVMQAYRHAVANGYRFFSYGDAMFLLRRQA